MIAGHGREVGYARAVQDRLLLVFHHIPRTAGTSMRQVVRANYRRRECAWLYRLAPGLDYRRWYEELPEERKTRLRCIAGHRANVLLPILDRPYRAFTLLRDPVARAVSSYHYMKSRALSARRRGKRQRDAGERIGQVILERGWTIADIYSELGDGGEASSDLHLQFRTFFNGQARSLLAPHVDTAALPYAVGSAGAAEWRDVAASVTAERYLVGAQELFAQSLALFASSFGWRHLFVPRRNANRLPGSHDLTRETRQLIHDHNWLDAELHEVHSERLRTVAPPRLPSVTTRSVVSLLGDVASRLSAPSARR